MIRRPRSSTPFPYTTLFRSADVEAPPAVREGQVMAEVAKAAAAHAPFVEVAHQHRRHLRFAGLQVVEDEVGLLADRKSTRLNSSHANISYAVFCLKKKNAN